MSAFTTAAAPGSREWLAEIGGCAVSACRRAQLDLARVDERVFSLEGDLGDFGGDDFRAAYPDRFIDVGIAEANLVGIAAGLAFRGNVPFVNTFATFALMRACEQVRLDVCYHNANVKIAGTFAGIAAGASGPTHQSVEDLAVARCLPNMVVLAPADALDAYQATVSAALHNGPVYLRLGLEPTPAVYAEPHSFEIGRGRMLAQGRHVGIVAAGLSSVANALAASRRLRPLGILATVVDMPSIKPIDDELLVRVARETGLVVTVEEHSVLGGLGGAVAEVLGERCPVPLHRVGIADEYCGVVGPYLSQLQRCGLDADGIAATVQMALKMRGGDAWCYESQASES